MRFLHCNPAVPGMSGFHHLMLEVTDPEQVRQAYYLVQQQHYLVQQQHLPVAMSLGKHTNDEMFSFYVRTPSGFEIEYGSGGG